MSEDKPSKNSLASKTIRLLWILVIGGFAIGEFHFQGVRSRRVLPPYDPTLYTSRGEQVGPAKGKLKIQLYPYTVYRNVPNQETERFTTDAHGFRGPFVDFSQKKKLRVAVIGGSAAFGLSAASDQDTFTGQLAGARPDWQIINAGVSGYLSGQELAFLVHVLADYEPDLVIAFDGWNDLFVQWFGEARHDGEFGYNSNFHGIENQLRGCYEISHSVWKAGLHFLVTLARKSALIEALGTYAAGKTRRDFLQKPPDDGVKRDEEYHRKITQAYISNLDKMGDFCRARGVRFLIAIQPEIGHRENPGKSERRYLRAHTFYRDHFPARYDRMIHEVMSSPLLSEERIINLNADHRIRLTQGVLFSDWVHLTRKGNLIVARILDEQIRQMLSE